MIPLKVRNASVGTAAHAILLARVGRGPGSRPIPVTTRSRATRKAPGPRPSNKSPAGPAERSRACREPHPAASCGSLGGRSHTASWVPMGLSDRNPRESLLRGSGSTVQQQRAVPCAGRRGRECPVATCRRPHPGRMPHRCRITRTHAGSATEIAPRGHRAIPASTNCHILSASSALILGLTCMILRLPCVLVRRMKRTPPTWHNSYTTGSQEHVCALTRARFPHGASSSQSMTRMVRPVIRTWHPEHSPSSAPASGSAMAALYV
ncbi:hypothetical protein HD595_001078 [Nonomuraea roseoviolacea subsp. carminata]|uniref:Uncharacterized protein n=1 Tax=Nonomuraea roseoviolacea subsp. carminata TaxID=160689 RepID=A0ABT1JT83_9ACTN|nr:hypothetical protein [Nonomuraea roseoviolacea subsp. carminata]